MAPKATAEARQSRAPTRIGRWCRADVSGAMRIADGHSVASLDARSAPVAPAPRATRARDDRRRRRRAAVHALGGLATARGARARDGNASARARRTRRAPDRL